MLLIASYYFYMSWNTTYGLLILFSTIVTWGSGLLLARYNSRIIKRTILVSCLLINLGILFVFKYANWGIDVVNQISSMFYWKLSIPNLDILLPVGISFYTFQAVGYTIDIYRKELNPETNFFTYALFVSFFPQLVAGPIERAKNLLPQFHIKQKFNSGNFYTVSFPDLG